MGKRHRAVAGVIAAFALSPASALAANWYASPTGTSEAPCTEAIPCDIPTALKDAKSGDNITLDPGTYGSPTPLSNTLTDGGKDVSIHGIAGQPRPVIDTTAQYGILLTGGGILSDVEVDNTSTESRDAAIWVDGTAATLTDVIGIDTGPNGIACYPDGTLTDSLCWASGTGGVAATPLISTTVTATLRNDTVIASGSGGDAVEVNGASSGTMEMDLYNTIAQGASEDILVQSPASDTGGAAIVTAHNSNFDAVKKGPGGDTFQTPSPTANGNQSAAPVFADAAAGNFHELDTSPTIGAGANSSLDGSTDLDGDPREIGGKTDIGAYEFVPGPVCSPAGTRTKYLTTTTIQLQCSFVLGGTLTYAITGGPNHGTASISATGLITYRPNPSFSGRDTVVYTVTSDSQTTATGSVEITVGREPAPVLSRVKLRKSTFTFKLNEPATVTLTFSEHGHKEGAVKMDGKAGNNAYRFTGKLPHARKKLTPGAYTVKLAASNAGGHSKSQTVKLTIRG